MRLIIVLTLLISSLSAFASDHETICSEFTKRAHTCIKSGGISPDIDETGEGCGTDLNFWEVELSQEATLTSKVTASFSQHQLTQTSCYSSYIREDNKKCYFTMYIELTDEDAIVNTQTMSCI